MNEIDPVNLTAELIKCPSVTPKEAGAITLIEDLLNKNGFIFWHDYVPGKESAKDVVKYLHEISKEKKIYHIKNTTLCFFKNSV